MLLITKRKIIVNKVRKKILQPCCKYLKGSNLRGCSAIFKGVQLSQLHQLSQQSYPQGVQLSQLHQPSQQSYPQGVQLSQLHQPSYGIYAKRAWRNAMPSYEFIGWCNVCSIGATFARLVQRLLGWCNVCSVGALETSAPPESTP